MEPGVVKELQTLERIVLNWKNNYSNMGTRAGGDEFLADDFREEIANHVSPFIRRLCENQISRCPRLMSFSTPCCDHVDELRRLSIEGD